MEIDPLTGSPSFFPRRVSPALQPWMVVCFWIAPFVIISTVVALILDFKRKKRKVTYQARFEVEEIERVRRRKSALISSSDSLAALASQAANDNDINNNLSLHLPPPQTWMDSWRERVTAWKVLRDKMITNNRFFRVLRSVFVCATFVAISIAFATMIIPKKMLNFSSESSFIFIPVFVTGADFLLLVIAMCVLKWPDRPDIPPPDAQEISSETALLIACNKSEWKHRDDLIATLDAALLKFEPRNIYVIDNNRSDTPVDGTEELCKERRINYLFLPEGNKTLSLYWAIKNWLPSSIKYVVMIDDDVVIPPRLEVPVRGQLKLADVLAIAYTIEAAGTPGETSRWKNLLVDLQDFEYKMAGYHKLLQTKWGTTLSAHGAISLWKVDALVGDTGPQVFYRHNTIFDGEDMQMGLLLHKKRRCWSIKTLGTECVRTRVPETLFPTFRKLMSIFFPCVSAPRPPMLPGQRLPEKSLFEQRVLSWDAFSHRFLLGYIRFLVSSAACSLHTLILVPYVVFEIWTIMMDWLRPFIIAYYVVHEPLVLPLSTLFYLELQWIVYAWFNFVTLRNRPDLQKSLGVVLAFPIYRLLLLSFRLFALLYNLRDISYAAARKSVASREDIGLIVPYHDNLKLYFMPWNWVWISAEEAESRRLANGGDVAFEVPQFEEPIKDKKIPKNINDDMEQLEGLQGLDNPAFGANLMDNTKEYARYASSTSIASSDGASSSGSGSVGGASSSSSSSKGVLASIPNVSSVDLVDDMPNNQAL